jgi:hypothetical protein
MPLESAMAPCDMVLNNPNVATELKLPVPKLMTTFLIRDAQLYTK